MSAFPKRFLLSTDVGVSGTGTSFGNYALNTSSRKVAVTFQARETGVLTAATVRVSSRGYASFNPQYKLSLQGVGTDGFPDGTIKGGGSPCSALFTVTDSSWNTVTTWVTFDNSYACTRGESLSLVIEPTGSPSSPDASNYLSFTTNMGSSINNRDALAKSYDGAAWAHVSVVNGAVFAYKINGVRHGCPVASSDYASFNINTTLGSGGDERGIVFTVPTWFCSRYAIRGANMVWANTAATTTVVTLYDAASDEVLQQVTFDGDFHTSSCPQLIFPKPYALLHAGKAYRLAAAPQTTTSMSLYYFGVTDAADWEAFSGAWFRSCYRADGGAWTAQDTRRYLLSPILHSIEPPLAVRTRPLGLERV